jgi:hypothetical protein
MNADVGLLERLHWLGHASFRLDGPPTIYFDPWRLKGQPPLADVILISHEHHDHCSPQDVERISGPRTVIVASHGAAEKLRGDVRTLRAGERTTVGEVEIEAVPAYNVNKSYHPKQAGHVGLHDGRRGGRAGSNGHRAEGGSPDALGGRRHRHPHRRRAFPQPLWRPGRHTGSRVACAGSSGETNPCEGWAAAHELAASLSVRNRLITRAIRNLRKVKWNTALLIPLPSPRAAVPGPPAHTRRLLQRS